MVTQLNWIYRWLDHGADSVNGGKNVKKSITGHTGWSQDLDFAFAHRDEVCNSLKRQKPHDPSAPYDGYDESDDTEEGARNNPLVSVNDVEKRKVLLFGAGVIGAYLAHVLIQAGNEVTILAREERAKSLSQNGLVIKHHLQRKTTKDPVEAVTLHGTTDPELKAWTEKLFEGTSYKLNWQDDMEAYLICHPAAILPIGYLSYICDGDLRSSTKEQRRMMVDASHEAFEALKAKGITIYPEGDDKFYENGARGKLMKLLYLIMSKSRIGDLIACEHCRNAVSEMEQIDAYYEELLKDYPKEKLETWNRLRGMMPSWDELHRKYGN